MHQRGFSMFHVAPEPAPQQLAHQHTQGVHDARTAQERLRHSWSKVHSPARAAAVETIRQAVSLKILDRPMAQYLIANVESSNTQEPRNGIFRGRTSVDELADVMMVSPRTVKRIRNGCRITGRRALADNRPNTVGIVRLDDESAQGGKLRCGRGIVALHYFHIAELERLVSAAKAPTMELPVKGDTVSSKENPIWDYDSQYAAPAPLTPAQRFADEDRAASCAMAIRDREQRQTQPSPMADEIATNLMRLEARSGQSVGAAARRAGRTIAPPSARRAEPNGIPQNPAAIPPVALEGAPGTRIDETPAALAQPASLMQGDESHKAKPHPAGADTCGASAGVIEESGLVDDVKRLVRITPDASWYDDRVVGVLALPPAHSRAVA